jgi:hypothetical protein
VVRRQGERVAGHRHGRAEHGGDSAGVDHRLLVARLVEHVDQSLGGEGLFLVRLEFDAVVAGQIDPVPAPAEGW